LQEAYDNCIEGLSRFRSQHLEYAARYIHLQAKEAVGNSTAVGTGGTPFMAYLRKH
jgi:indoleamine 2,3-dioxygenase